MTLGFIFAALLLSQLADAVTTTWAVFITGIPIAYETNPLMRDVLLAGPATIFGIKVLGAAFASRLIYYGSEKHPKMAKWVLLFVVALGLIAAAVNSCNIAVYSSSMQ